MKTLIAAIITTIALQAVSMPKPSVDVNWRFQRANDMKVIHGNNSVYFMPSSADSSFATDSVVQKSIFLKDLALTMKNHINEYHKACMPVHTIRPLEKDVTPNKSIKPCPPYPPFDPKDCTKKRRKVAASLLQTLEKLDEQLNQNPKLSGEKVVETMDVARTLASNMKKEQTIYDPRRAEMAPMKMIARAAAPGALNVTAGGAKDFGFFKKVVQDGMVPAAESLTIEGFLSEFNLSLDRDCYKLICVYPALAQQNGKLYVQIGMGSNVTTDTFSRKPLNLSIVLDISGSMSSTDNTEKSRLEWAKNALIHTVRELNEDDMLSVVLFDSNSEVLIPAQRVVDHEAIIQKVRALETKGSTNLEAGLRDGYELVSQNLYHLEDYENRIILISDAGLNTGVTDQANVLKLITDYANEGIGLTAIGLGLNFNQDFIHGITQSRGGNYVFVHSGKAMYENYFKAFDYLVTPVAYNFKANLSMKGINAKLVKAYGVPATEDEPVHELISIQTLFFSEAGGTILLEYDINK